VIGYLKGKVLDIYKDSILLDVHDVGYSVLTPNPYQYQINTEVSLYIYTYVREDQLTLFGFTSMSEKEAFLKTIQVKGIGPKTALGIFAAVDYSHFVQAIENENINFLKKLPGIGLKSASQIILDLKGKLALTSKMNNHVDDAIEALIALGYKESDVNKVMKSINDDSLSTEAYIKQALGLLLK